MPGMRARATRPGEESSYPIRAISAELAGFHSTMLLPAAYLGDPRPEGSLRHFEPVQFAGVTLESTSGHQAWGVPTRLMSLVAPLLLLPAARPPPRGRGLVAGTVRDLRSRHVAPPRIAARA